MIRYLYLFCLLSSPIVVNAQETESQLIDSIVHLRALSRQVEFNSERKLKYARIAYDLSKRTKSDTTKLNSVKNLSFSYYNSGDNINYGAFSHETLKLATKLNDTSVMANTNFHLATFHFYELSTDSAYYYYYSAQKLFAKINDAENQASVLLNMADIQESEKDYAGCEKNAIQAMRLLQSIPETNETLESLWSLNNLLALVSERLERRQEAIEYYNKTLAIAEKLDNSRYYYLSSINNLAYTYEGLGQLDKAMNYYQEVAGDKELFNIDPELFVIAIGNVARLEFMLDSTKAQEAKNILFNTLKITDSLEDTINEMGIYGFLADIYDKTKKRDSAVYFSKKLLEYSKRTNSNTERLQALKMLGKLEAGPSATSYLNEHIRLSDSLLKNERNARDKFTRIEFETEEIIAEKDQLSKERLIFLLSSIGLLITIILIYVIVTQRSKNKALRFNQMQQEANEEIYNLMLAQQDKVEEGRSHEKKRISKELHDGVLGKLFGTRLSLDSLNLVHTDEAVKNRSKYIDGLQSIETEIRKISHDLSNDFVTGSSFNDIVTTLIETQTKAYQLNYTLDTDDHIDWEIVPNKTKMNIYRMLQETMQNIYKHAQATEIKISFKLKNDVILLTVEDDGIGFNVNKAKKGIGVKNINSRAEEMGGSVNIHSEKGTGTMIEISIPTLINTELK